MDMTGQILIFVRVVEMGSISAAARANGQTPSAVSKQITHLEDRIGQRLLHRTKTGVTLTEDGRQFYRKCEAMAEAYHGIEEHISALGDTPKGTLRVASSVSFGKLRLIPALPEFFARYPDITLSLKLTDRQINIEEGDFDAAVNFAEQLDDPMVVARKIMRNERVLCAAPAYIAAHGMPQTFRDLERLNCLRVSEVDQRNAWTSTHGGKTETIATRGNFIGNSADSVLQAALAGLGVARLSTYLVEPRFASGELVRVLPHYAQKNTDIAVVFANKRNLPPKTRVFVEFLVEKFLA